MLFVIDKGLKHTKIVDGTFRVKRVCFDSKIIETFCSQGSFYTPVKVCHITQSFDFKFFALCNIDVVMFQV
jgi:hypothetical protein